MSVKAFNSLSCDIPNISTFLDIAEKLKLAADTFRAVRSESQARQALALRDKALDMATLMDHFELKEDAA